jgi:predicted DNA-binding protein
MYKSVNISDETYKKLQSIATQLNKPKAQIVAVLVKRYGETMQEKELAKLAKFNKEMGAKIKALRFSKNIAVDTTNIDADFSALGDTDYMR